MDFKTSLPPLSKEDIFAYSINKHRPKENVKLSTMLTEEDKFEFYSINAYSNSNFAYDIQLAIKSRKSRFVWYPEMRRTVAPSLVSDGTGIFFIPKREKQLNIRKIVNDYPD